MFNARRAMHVGCLNGNLPTQPAARCNAHILQGHRQQATLTCSPAETTTSYSRASCNCATSRVSPTKRLVSPTWPTPQPQPRDRFNFALDMRRHIANARDIANRSATKFHDQTRHDTLSIRPPVKTRYIARGLEQAPITRLNTGLASHECRKQSDE